MLTKDLAWIELELRFLALRSIKHTVQAKLRLLTQINVKY